LVEAHFNLGITLQSIQNMDRAEAAYRRAIEVQSDYAPAHNNLGKLFLDLGRCEAAFDCFRRALEIQPNFLAAHLNLGIALATTGEHHAAMASYQRVLELEPTNADAHLGMGEAQKYYGDFDASIASILRALEIKPDYALAHSNLLFQRNYLQGSSEALSFVNAKSFGKMASQIASAYTHWPNPAIAHRCLRVGFVSGDLSNHPVGYFVECVVAALSAQNPTPFELVAYSTHNKTDEVSQRIRAHFDAWHSVERLSDEDLARHIWNDGIDILVDLSGHTAHNRLPVFAWRPAPVQVSWLGYFATTGVAEMDYIIADYWTLPPEQETFFTEKIWRLPETRLCFTAPNVDAEVNPLPAATNGFVTFGCFNNLSKMNDAVVGLWAQILNQLPDSKLFLKCPQLSESAVQAGTCARFAEHGIASYRLIFEHYDTRAKYLATYHRIDIALDPFPYPGGTTTVEALWMGIPVLTLPGDQFLSRQGVGLLMNAGLPDWVATDANDYIARTVGHANDLPKLAALRARLREQVLASPVFDAPRFAKHFEEALREMWNKWCDAQALNPSPPIATTCPAEHADPASGRS
jgi:predicted O-linked N-acetylglucosamine transferase (SPINDLY family)